MGTAATHDSLHAPDRKVPRLFEARFVAHVLTAMCQAVVVVAQVVVVVLVQVGVVPALAWGSYCARMLQASVLVAAAVVVTAGHARPVTRPTEVVVVVVVVVARVDRRRRQVEPVWVVADGASVVVVVVVVVVEAAARTPAVPVLRLTPRACEPMRAVVRHSSSGGVGTV